MNRKHNPYVSLVALVLAAVILVLACTGCNAEAEAAERDDHHAVIIEETETEPETEPAHTFRFKIEREYTGSWHVNNVYVITDTQTGVQYLFIGSADGSGLTPLLPGEG